MVDADSVENLGRKTRPPWIWLVGLPVSLFFGLLLGTKGLLTYWSLDQRGSLDTAYFMQRLYQGAFGIEPCRTVLVTEIGEGVIAGRHFEPIMALLLPIIRLAPHTESLFLIQGLFVGATLVPIILMGKRILKDNISTGLLALAWIFWPLTWSLGSSDFRTLALATPFLAAIWASAIHRRPIWLMVSTALAVVCREEIPWFVLAGMPGILWSFRQHKQVRRLGRWLPFLCIAYLILITSFLGGSSTHVAPFAFMHTGEWMKHLNSLFQTLERLGQSTGLGIVATLLSPLWAGPILLQWAGLYLAGNLGDLSYTHYLSPTIATLPLLWALGAKRLSTLFQKRLSLPQGSMKWAMRSILGLLLIHHAMSFSQTTLPELTQRLPLIPAEKARPKDRPDSVWPLVAQIPEFATVLTSEGYLAPLAARSYLYNDDELFPEYDNTTVIPVIDWALLQDESRWLPVLLKAGFVERSRLARAILLQAPPSHTETPPYCF